MLMSLAIIRTYLNMVGGIDPVLAAEGSERPLKLAALWVSCSLWMKLQRGP